MSQKALFLTKAQGEFKVESRTIPTPGAGELLVKIEAAALNHIEWKIQAYGIYISEYPIILGADASGVVETVGEGVADFRKGDEVFHQGDFRVDYATFQQFHLVPADVCAKKPSNIPFDEASSIPSALITAAQCLYGERKSTDIFKLSPPGWEAGGEHTAKGKTVVIFGGASSVGQNAIQLAKLSGFSQIIATASLHNAPFLKSIGATTVVDRKAQNLQAEINKAVKGVPIDVVLDAISLEDTQSVAWDVLAPNGTLVLLLDATVDRSKYPKKMIVNDIYGSVHAPHLRALGVSLYAALPKLIETGAIRPNRVEVLPGGLRSIANGQNRLRENKVSGIKLVVHPQETE